MTRCLECGGPVKSRLEHSYRYAESGLPNMVLVDAVTITTCTKCGETYVGLQAIETLHREIAHALLLKKGRLAAEEIRFLRKWLGWSGSDFAKRMGTAPETVSRWENGKTPIGPQADRLLRVLVSRSDQVMEYPDAVLEQIATDKGSAKPVTVQFKHEAKKGWIFLRGPALVTA